MSIFLGKKNEKGLPFTKYLIVTNMYSFTFMTPNRRLMSFERFERAKDLVLGNVAKQSENQFEVFSIGREINMELRTVRVGITFFTFSIPIIYIFKKRFLELYKIDFYNILGLLVF